MSATGTVEKAVAVATDPLGAAAGAVAGPVTGAIGSAVSGAIGPLVSGFARIGLYILFTAAGVGLVVLAIARMTKGPAETAAKGASALAPLALAAA